MNQLSTYSVHLGLSKQEFFHQLKCYSASSLCELRTLLFEDAEQKGCIPPEVRNVPLVYRRDSALQPVANALGEDIWSLAQSIPNGKFQCGL